MNLGDLFYKASGNVKHSLAMNGWIRPPFEEADAISVRIPNDAGYDDVVEWWRNIKAGGVDLTNRILQELEVPFIHELFADGNGNNTMPAEYISMFIHQGIVPQMGGNLLNNAVQTYRMMADQALHKVNIEENLLLNFHRCLTAGEVYDKDCGSYRSMAVEGGHPAYDIRHTMNKAFRQTLEFLDFHQTKNHALLAACYMYITIVRVLPFIAYNDMVAKVMLNFILMKYDLPPVCIYAEDTFSAMHDMDLFVSQEDIIPFMSFVRISTQKTWHNIMNVV